MSLGRQTGAVDKDGVFHAQLRRSGVHLFHKGALAAGQVFRHGHTGVVAGGHGDGLEHVMDGERFPLLHVDLRASHTRRGGGDGDHGFLGDGALFQGLHDEEHGHYLGDAGQLQGIVGVLLIQDLACGLLHEQNGLGVDLRPRRLGGEEAPAQDQTEKGGEEFLHRRTSW